MYKYRASQIGLKQKREGNWEENEADKIKLKLPDKKYQEEVSMALGDLDWRGVTDLEKLQWKEH